MLYAHILAVKMRVVESMKRYKMKMERNWKMVEIHKEMEKQQPADVVVILHKVLAPSQRPIT